MGELKRMPDVINSCLKYRLLNRFIDSKPESFENELKTSGPFAYMGQLPCQKY